MARESIEEAMEAIEHQQQTEMELAAQHIVDDGESQQHPPDPHHRHNHRYHHRRHHRHHRRSQSSRSARYEKSILHLGTAHIVIGIICVVLQMVQFTNNSILSQAQPGLWCGSFFVITGSVCLGLASIKGIYSTLAMLAFSLVSIFMALILASLSWFGAEEAQHCQIYWNEYCVIPSNQSTLRPPLTTTLSPYNLTTVTTGSVALQDGNLKRSFEWTSSADVVLSSSNNSSSEDDCSTTTVPVPDSVCCWDLYHGYCGYDIGLGRTIHSLLVICGLAGCITGFILSTLACSRPGGRDNAGLSGRPRLTSIFSIDTSDHTPAVGRPITPWEFPPPSKNPLPADDNVVGFGFPNEPPPPYVEQDNLYCTSYL